MQFDRLRIFEDSKHFHPAWRQKSRGSCETVDCWKRWCLVSSRVLLCNRVISVAWGYVRAVCLCVSAFSFGREKERERKTVKCEHSVVSVTPGCWRNDSCLAMDKSVLLKTECGPQKAQRSRVHGIVFAVANEQIKNPRKKTLYLSFVYTCPVISKASFWIWPRPVMCHLVADEGSTATFAW